jgi:hypothetical protein
MSAVIQETEMRDFTAATTSQGRGEFSQKYSKGELEEMSSRELLDGYAE